MYISSHQCTYILLELIEFRQTVTRNYCPHIRSTVTSYQCFISATRWFHKVKSKIWDSVHQQPIIYQCHMISDLIEFCRIVSKELLPTHDNTIQYSLFSNFFYKSIEDSLWLFKRVTTTVTVITKVQVVSPDDSTRSKPRFGFHNVHQHNRIILGTNPILSNSAKQFLRKCRPQKTWSYLLLQLITKV